ncbi:unnamed protein product [Callosobruchus maculatus]|uniref:Uncharacterized protein n=1 Tax=Callosobruchus maculatus TaxID=64391 RepID=A0A653C0H6_CALMS|nr:unnamed protein product [Callosobruchus maculatus]
MASSGVEKMVKLWSAIPIGNWKGSILKEHADPTRAIYTHEDYITLVGTTERINHDYSDQSTNEDAKMMAFFDSLIQREIEGWDSQSEESLSSNSASEEEQDWSKVISQIFRNGRHSSEEPRKFKTNRITQLISKKKNRLAKLAHNKSSSYIRRKNHQEKAQKKKLLKSKTLSRKHNGFNKRSYRKSSSDREHRRKKSVKEPRASKYFTRQSLRNSAEQSSLDVPSTSTGITSSKSSIFRLIEQDSDEEPRNSNENPEGEVNAEELDETNFINILPTPINGTKDILINVLEMAHRNVPQNQRSHPVTRSQHHIHQQQEESASHSSNSSRQAIDDGFSDTSDSDLEYGHTPKRRCISAASDSGCCPSSSASSCSTKNGSLIEKVPYPKNHQTCSSGRRGGDSSEEEGGRRYEKIRRRARNSKATAVRRKIAHDSDSN